MNRKEYAVAVFLDMDKVFDRVWHDEIVYKMTKYSLPRRIVSVIRSFLTHRTFRVVVEGALSAPRPILAGVPQGSCLSPACYPCYTDDIPTTPETTLALYADDAAYITTSTNARHAARKMQRALDTIPEWLAKWRLSVNVGKTQALVTGDGTLPPPLKLQGANVEWTSQCKYLGVTIDRRLTMGLHVTRVVTQCRVARNLLYPVLSSPCPCLQAHTKLGVYKTYIRSILTYATPAWFALTSESTEHLAVPRHAPRYVRNDVIQRNIGIKSLDEFVGASCNLHVRAGRRLCLALLR